MKRALVVLGLSGLLPTALSAAAPSQVEVWSRAYRNSCGYYTNTGADFDVTFKDVSLPWGTKVFLVSGLGGTESSTEVHWDERLTQEMSAVAPSTWRVRRTVTLNNRGQPSNFSALEFVIEIREPNRDPRFITGDGFLVTKVKSESIQCVTGTTYPSFQKMKVDSVNQ